MADGQQIAGALVAAEIATPATPASGVNKIYPKSDKRWYGLDSDGLERRISNKAPTQQVLTVGSGTYTTPAGCLAILVEGVAGGGGGGGCAGSATQAAAGSGGHAGGYFSKLIASPASTYAYTVGAKGTGGAAGANQGNAGSDTTFGAGGGLLTAKGGPRGNAGALGTAFNVIPSSTLSSGPSTGGDVNAAGGRGGSGIRQSATSALGGDGGASFYGGGGRGPDDDADGGAAQSPGAGGGGAVVSSVNTARAGGDGADGLVIVTEFY